MISSLLKSFFRKLPEPLFTNSEWSRHLVGKLGVTADADCDAVLQGGTRTSSMPTGSKTRWRGWKFWRGWWAELSVFITRTWAEPQTCCWPAAARVTGPSLRDAQVPVRSSEDRRWKLWEKQGFYCFSAGFVWTQTAAKTENVSFLFRWNRGTSPSCSAPLWSGPRRTTWPTWWPTCRTSTGSWRHWFRTWAADPSGLVLPWKQQQNSDDFCSFLVRLVLHRRRERRSGGEFRQTPPQFNLLINVQQW